MSSVASVVSIFVQHHATEEHTMHQQRPIGTDSRSRDHDHAAICDVIERWVVAAGAADVEGVLEAHTDDIVMFDVPPPEDGARGLGAYAATWPPFFEWMRTGGIFELVELDVTAGAETAFAWALLRCGDAAGLREHPDRRLRITIGLRREDDRWLIAHEHHSFTLGA